MFDPDDENEGLAKMLKIQEVATPLNSVLVAYDCVSMLVRRDR